MTESTQPKTEHPIKRERLRFLLPTSFFSLREVEGDLFELSELLERWKEAPPPDAQNYEQALVMLNRAQGRIENIILTELREDRAPGRPASNTTELAVWVHVAVYKHGARLAEAIDAVCHDLPAEERTLKASNRIRRRYHELRKKWLDDVRRDWPEICKEWTADEVAEKTEQLKAKNLPAKEHAREVNALKRDITRPIEARLRRVADELLMDREIDFEEDEFNDKERKLLSRLK